MFNKKKKVLLIAPLQSHATMGRVAALVGTDFDIYALDVSISDYLIDTSAYPLSCLKEIINLKSWQCDHFYSQSSGRLQQLMDCARGYSLLPESSFLQKQIKSALLHVEPDVIFNFYGPLAIHYARIIKKMRIEIPVVHVFNLYPCAVNNSEGIWGNLRGLLCNEFIDYKMHLQEIEGLVFASSEMQTYVNEKYKLKNSNQIVLPDLLPKSFFCESTRQRTEIQNENPRLIFLGGPGRSGGKIDSLDGFFQGFATHSLHIYAGQMSEAVIKTGYGHKYPYFSTNQVFTGELGNYANQFDASIIHYNVYKRHERFRTTIPTRFFTSLTALIPIFIKSGIFDACESFVDKYQIGTSFTDFEDLKSKLFQKDKLESYRYNCYKNVDCFQAESQSGLLSDFLHSLL